MVICMKKHFGKHIEMFLPVVALHHHFISGHLHGKHTMEITHHHYTQTLRHPITSIHCPPPPPPPTQYLAPRRAG